MTVWVRHSVLAITSLSLVLLAGSADAASRGCKYDPEVDCSAYKTYDWQPEERRQVEDSPLALGGSADTLIRNAIDEQLRSQGFELVGDGEPDFLVSYDGALEPVTDFEGYRRELASGVSWVVEGNVSSYTRGTLVITIHEPGRETPVWSSWTTETIKNPGQPEKQIRKVVRKLLRRFPPR